MIVKSKRLSGLYYVNKKPLLIENLELHKKLKTTFTEKELKDFEKWLLNLENTKAK